MSDQTPSPTDPRVRVDRELARWSGTFAGSDYYYGEEAGPVARRAVRYHRFIPGATALDLGCGEGQDLAYLAGLGYRTTGVEFTPPGAEKARRFVEARGVKAEVVEQNIREFLREGRQFDLVVAANSLQFLGADAPDCLDRTLQSVAPGGVAAISMFARESGEPDLSGTVYFITMDELLARFADWQPLEAAKLWQWNVATNQPQPFVTLIARRLPPVRPRLLQLR